MTDQDVRCRCEAYAAVTERAALAGARWLGRGDVKGAEESAATAMREGLDALEITVFSDEWSLPKPSATLFRGALRELGCEPHENSPADVLATEAVTREIRRLLLELKPIEADILRQRFGLGVESQVLVQSGQVVES